MAEGDRTEPPQIRREAPRQAAVPSDDTVLRDRGDKDETHLAQVHFAAVHLVAIHTATFARM
jgi:hypothetical protein